MIKLSQELIDKKVTLLDNIFISDYMPSAPESFIKVYIYGLYCAGNNSLTFEELARALNLEKETVVAAYSYYDEQGLVSLFEAEESVEYLAVRPISSQIKKFNKEKYKTFNEQLHVMLPSRNILPNEYYEYYSIMETLHIEVEAMLTIIGYCIRLKGGDISYPYILAVARNLAHEGYTTYDRVQEKLSEMDLNSGELRAILKALSLKRNCEHDDLRLYTKWIKQLGFNVETVIGVAKKVKKGGMARLDALLIKYYENHLYSLKEIEDYNKVRDDMFELAKKINRIIGVYYEQLDFIVETYISSWLTMGFDETTLLTIADYCFRHGKRSLEEMNETARMFFKQGLLSSNSIADFMSQATRQDEKIKKILAFLGISRAVISRDRDYYRTWIHSWKMTEELLEYAASLSVGKDNPVAYMNKILATWFDKNITTVENAKKVSVSSITAPDNRLKIGESVVSKNYSSEELNALFDSLTYDDI